MAVDSKTVGRRPEARGQGSGTECGARGARRWALGAGRWAVGAALAVAVLCHASAGLSGATPQADPPRRIISVIPAVTEMLFAIGAGPQVVGVSSFAELPKEISALPRVGGLIDPDLERIISLRPDLVILYASQLDAQEQLARAEIPVFAYVHRGLAHVMHTIRALGERTANTAGAERVATGIERDLEAIRERVKGRPRPRTLLVFEREPLTLRNIYASGGIGFLHDMLEIAGGTNVFAAVNRERLQPTTETILAAAPDVIVEVRYSSDGTTDQNARERQTWDVLSAVPAVRDDRVHFLTGGDLVVPGPRVAAATARLARVLHPEAF